MLNLSRRQATRHKGLLENRDLSLRLFAEIYLIYGLVRRFLILNVFVSGQFLTHLIQGKHDCVQFSSNKTARVSMGNVDTNNSILRRGSGTNLDFSEISNGSPHNKLLIIKVKLIF